MTSSALPAKIVVVGSANQDYIVRVPHPPGPGETALASSLLQQPGGKGANQAVAAARLRGDVSFVASVGDDADGASLIRELRAEGVDTADVEIIRSGRTGLALVSVYDSGENSITVIPGTNFSLKPDRVAHTVARIGSEFPGAILVAQAEVLPEVIEAGVRAAAQAGMRVVLNLAPYQPLPADVLGRCDPLVVNEAEASALAGSDVHDAATAQAAVRRLRDTVRSVVVTIGADGAYWGDREGDGHVPAPAVPTVVDTTGAGDAFVGAVAASLARGGSLEAAVRVGVSAGSYAVGSPGAQSSYATPADLRLDGYPVDA